MSQLDLMIHVERIVRPVRALDRRKLAMRRELLAHLQAALEEERAGGASEADALAAAQRRLGDPAQLTRDLQRSVPPLQRALLSIVPMPRWASRWEKRSGEKMGLRQMTLTQAGLATLGTMLISYGAAALLAMLYVAKYRAAALHALTDHSWTYPAGHLLANTLLIAFLVLCFKLLGRTAHESTRPATLIAYAAAIAALLSAWMATIVGMVAGQTPDWLELSCCPLMAALVVLLLSGLGRLLAHIGRDQREWLALKLDDCQ